LKGEGYQNGVKVVLVCKERLLMKNRREAFSGTVLPIWCRKRGKDRQLYEARPEGTSPSEPHGIRVKAETGGTRSIEVKTRITRMVQYGKILLSILGEGGRRGGGRFIK